MVRMGSRLGDQLNHPSGSLAILRDQQIQYLNNISIGNFCNNMNTKQFILLFQSSSLYLLILCYVCWLVVFGYTL